MLPSPETRRIVAAAEAAAGLAFAAELTPVHLLAALLDERPAGPLRLLSSLGVDLAALRVAVARELPAGEARVAVRRRPPRWTLAARTVVESAGKAAERLASPRREPLVRLMQPEHLLLSLAGTRETAAQRLLAQAGAGYRRVRDAVVREWAAARGVPRRSQAS